MFLSSGDVEVRVGIHLDILLSDYRLSLHVGLRKNRIAHLGGQKKDKANGKNQDEPVN